MRKEIALKYLKKNIRITLKGSNLFYSGILSEVTDEIIVLENQYKKTTSIELKDILSIEERE